MEREYVRGNREHWKDVYEYIHGVTPATYCQSGTCSNDKVIFAKNKDGLFTFYIDPLVMEAITTNPNWHEVKPWEDKPYEPKPFDKVLGWNDDYPFDIYADIFLHKHKCWGTNKIVYTCAFGGYWEHVKPYNEEEYLKSLDDGCK